MSHNFRAHNSNPFRGRDSEKGYQTERTTTTAPAPSAKTEEREASETAPSYAHADKQKGPVDTESESRGKEDEQLRVRQGKNPFDVEQTVTQLKPPTHVVKDNEKSDAHHTDTDKKGNNYDWFWDLEIDYDLEEVTETVKNSYVPNAMAMFEILDQAGSFVYDSRVVAKHHTDFLDYGVACYYSILFHIQILRAQRAAGMLYGQNESFLRRFERKFKFEELPIASVLEPFFNTIISVKLPDSMYNWIIPEHAPGLFHATMAGYAKVATTPGFGGQFLQPNVPFMLSILKTAISRDRINHLSDTMRTSFGGAETSTETMYFNDNGEYIPGRFSTAAPLALFGIRYTRNETRTDTANTLFASVGVSYPFHADYDTLVAAAPKWRRSPFDQLPASLADGTRVINDLENFLIMDKSNDMEWFRELILQATTHARFFGKGCTLSDVDTTGGKEPLITCQHKKKDRRGEAISYDNASLGLQQMDLEDPYYPRTFKDTVGSFYTSRNGIKRQEVLQVMAFAINANIYIGTRPNRVGESDEFRKGPYWNNKTWTATRFADSGTQGKQMFKGWKTMIQSKAALIKPVGY
jgi:hypothetical protein